MQRELGGEIGDGAIEQFGIAAREPGAVALREQFKAADDTIVALEKDRILRLLLKELRRDLAKELDGVVPRAPPQAVVDPVEQLARVQLPTPPEVLADVSELPDALRDMVRHRRGRGRGRDLRLSRRLRWFSW